MLNREGDWDEKDKIDYASDLEGVEEESDLKIKVKVEEGTIRIYKPQFFADVDIGLLEQSIKVGLETKVVQDIKLKGELKFNKVIEVCLFGFDMEIPYGRAYLGVFLIVDAKGQVDVEARVISTTMYQVGFKAQAYCFIPVYVGPFAGPELKSVDVGFKADATIEAKIAVVPQAGLEICDFQIGSIQLWMGLKVNAEIHAKGGLQGDVDEKTASADGEANGHLRLDAFLELKGYLLGVDYSIFYKDWKLYDHSWSVGEETNSGQTTMEIIPCSLSIYADAYKDKIRGHVITYSAPSERSISNNMFGDSYVGDGITIYIKNKSGKTSNFPVSTNSFGEFELYNKITPEDTVWAVINKVVTKNGVDRKMSTKSDEIKPSIPFDKITFLPDAFNDVVRGTVSGDYSGPLTIIKENAKGSTRIAAQAVVGEFSANVPLAGGDNVKVVLPFEDVNFPLNPQAKPASLDVLELTMYVNVPKNEVSGSIQNMYEESAAYYGKDVKFTSFLINGDLHKTATQKAKVYKKMAVVKDTKSPSGQSIKEVNTSTSTYKFPVETIIFTITIEYEGIKKSITYDPINAIYKEFKNKTVQKDQTSPIDDKINPRVNPGEIDIPVEEFETIR